jgi:hypothetical protein
MALIGDTEGRLHVQRQVEDYAFRGVEFDMMGFLTFTVETYERRITKEQNDNGEPGHSTRSQYGHYSQSHSRSATHTRVCRSENHTFLPNIVGSWLPRRDGEENTQSYYHAAMLAFLKPWRTLHDLKTGFEDWESAFRHFMETASQRDRDVVVGCQYYYDSRDAKNDGHVDEEMNVNDGEEGRSEELEGRDVIENESSLESVRDLY